MKVKNGSLAMTKRNPWVNPVMWFVAVLVVNSLWSAVASQEAPNEVNSPSQTQTYREVVVAPVADLDRALPARMAVTFTAGSTDSGEIGYSILLNNQTEITSWNGDLGEEVPQWNGKLSPGTYTIETVTDEGIVAQQELYIKPFAAYQLEGHILLSLLLVGFAFAEQGVRALAGRLQSTGKQQPVERTPFKRIAKGMPELDQLPEHDSPWREPLR